MVCAARADARNGETDIHGRTDALVEQVGLQEDLAVGDRDHVGRDVGRDVVGLGFNDRQCRQRAAAVFVAELRGALEQAGVKIEHVARISFAARRAAQQKRHLAIGDGLLGQIVIDDHGVHAVVAEIFAHGAAGEGRQELHRGRIGSGGGNDDGVVQRAVLFERLDELCNGRTLLSDGDVDAIELLGLVSALVERLLVDDGVDARPRSCPSGGHR